MSEICFDCYNKLEGGHEEKRNYRISKDLDLCEECGEYKPVVICMKRRYIYQERFLEWIKDMRQLYGKK